MTHYIEGAVPLAELARATKRPVAEIEAEAVALALFVGIDWAGRPALGERDARQVVTGDARRAREHDDAWQEFLTRCATWTDARDQAVRDAHEAIGADPRQGPEKHSAARDAGIEAGRRFELSNPPPTWVEGVEDGNAVRRYSDRPQDGGLLKRAAAALTGAGR